VPGRRRLLALGVLSASLALPTATAAGVATARWGERHRPEVAHLGADLARAERAVASLRGAPSQQGLQSALEACSALGATAARAGSWKPPAASARHALARLVSRTGSYVRTCLAVASVTTPGAAAASYAALGAEGRAASAAYSSFRRALR